MATLAIAGTYTLTSGVRSAGTMATSLTLTGSNYSSIAQNITGSTWQGLSTSSLSDIRNMFLENLDGTASIAVATDSSGTNRISHLWPYDMAIIPWTGSTGLYAKALDASTGLVYSGTAVLGYILTEK